MLGIIVCFHDHNYCDICGVERSSKFSSKQQIIFKKYICFDITRHKKFSLLTITFCIGLKLLKKNIVVIGASAGGIEVLERIISKLPKDFSASIFIVLHTAANSPGVLDFMLERAGLLPVKYVKQREKIRLNQIYLPIADHHLVLDKNEVVCVTRGPKENRSRPAIDPLFRSAAQAFGTQVIGIILSGMLDDGTAGLQAIKQLGGTAIVQDPLDAKYPSMPRSAINHIEVDHCVLSSEIAPLLIELTQQDTVNMKDRTVPEEIKTEVSIASEHDPINAGILNLGKPSIYTCPSCHGTLLEIRSNNIVRYRCHTGHAYSIQTLAEEIEEKIEDSLWNAIRTIEEQVLLMRQLAEDAHENGDNTTSEQLFDRANSIKKPSELIRQTLFTLNDLKI